MSVPASTCDRLIWGAAISLGVALSGTFSVRPAAASGCCHTPPQCCYPPPADVIAPVPPPVEEETLNLAAIDPEYVLTKVLIPVIYACLILRIAWLIQQK